MTYLKNEKIYKRRRFVIFSILFLIGLSIGIVFVSGFIHLFSCRCETKVIAAPTNISEEVIVEESEIISLGEYKLTAYCACKKCCGKTNGITASGVRAKEGVTIAADTSVLPFGTVVLIDGHEYTVQDRGGAIKGNRIDVFFDSHQKALEFGVQHKEIFMKGV